MNTSRVRTKGANREPATGLGVGEHEVWWRMVVSLDVTVVWKMKIKASRRYRGSQRNYESLVK